MFQVKVCGITCCEDAVEAATAEVDAIGLNFYPRSVRHISFKAAREIVAALPEHIVKVGLFVNAEASHICRLFDELPLDLVQLHGDEPPEFLTELGGRPVIRAFRVAGDGLSSVTAYLERCRALHALPMFALLDALSSEGYGGTGERTDWLVAGEYAKLSGMPPLVLAGGLTPQNVAAAIHAVRPAVVDVASGVESSPGRKDHAAVQAFVRAARAAFRTLQGLANQGLDAV